MDCWYSWAKKQAESMMPSYVPGLGTVDAGDALNDVWFRPAFAAERARWVPNDDGIPMYEGSDAGPRAYLRRTLDHWRADRWRRQKVRGGQHDSLDPAAEPPVPAPAEDPRSAQVRESFEEFFRSKPLYGWILYVTDVAGSRSPDELALETGLSPSSIHNTVRRSRAEVLRRVLQASKLEEGIE